MLYEACANVARHAYTDREGGLGPYIIRPAMEWFTYGYSSEDVGNALHMEKILGNACP